MSQTPPGPEDTDAEPEVGGNLAEELAYRLRQQDLVSQFGLFALRSHTIADVFQEATRVSASGLKVALCKLLRYIPEEEMLLIVAGVGWKEGVVGTARLGVDLESPGGYAFQSGQPLVSNHLSAESRFRTPRLLRDHGVTRAINVPVRDGERPFGVLEVDSPDTSRFSFADTAFLQSIANIISVAFERWKVEEQLKLERQRSELLAQEQQHRIKNLFAVTGALLRLSERDAARDGSSPLELAQERLAALSRASSLSMGDPGAMQELTDAVRLTGEVLAPYDGNVRIHGEGIELSSEQVPLLALMLHEFATNAVKYGAFAGEDGAVEIDWTRTDEEIRLSWAEHGAPPRDQDTNDGGFGSTLIKSVSVQIGAEVVQEWREEGLCIEVRFACPSIDRDKTQATFAP
ncbi:sensor histidine kinase [Limimaricola soesokkakensis]|uniref:sensor histidine kinase n=1 Tax=Limimaricola soesokkakensis TaxID=1343159 RepID=UPI0035181EE4